MLHNNIVFTKGVNRQYSDEFGRVGAKIGSTVNIRLPHKYFVRTGAPIQVNATSETYVPLTLNTQYGVDVSFSSAELTLSLDDFSKRILTPAMARLSSRIDYDGMAQALNVFNMVGNPGTTPGSVVGGAANTMTDATCPICYLNAGVHMTNNATPRDESRRIVVNPNAMAQSMAALRALLQDSSLISEQYRKGVMGIAFGFEFAEDQNVNTLTTGTHAGSGTAIIAGVSQVGSTVNTSGWTANSAILSQGEVIQLAGVNSVNPENMQNTGFAANFVVTANVISTAGGLAAIPVYPPIILPGAQVTNATVTASPTNGGAVTVMSGAASTAFPQNIAYHQDAFTLGTADLELPKGVDFSGREMYDGISMRIVRAYDINNDQFPCRIDVLAGWATLRPEMACRISG